MFFHLRPFCNKSFSNFKHEHVHVKMVTRSVETAENHLTLQSSIELYNVFQLFDVPLFIFASLPLFSTGSSENLTACYLPSTKWQTDKVCEHSERLKL